MIAKLTTEHQRILQAYSWLVSSATVQPKAKFGIEQWRRSPRSQSRQGRQSELLDGKSSTRPAFL